MLRLLAEKMRVGVRKDKHSMIPLYRPGLSARVAWESRVMRDVAGARANTARQLHDKDLAIVDTADCSIAAATSAGSGPGPSAEGEVLVRLESSRAPCRKSCG